MSIGDLDTRLLLLINQGCANPILDRVMPFLTFQGYLLVLPVFLYLLFRTMTREPRERPSPSFVFALFLVCCVSVLFADLVEHLIKDAVGRPRPCRTLDGIRMLIACPRSFSMPSGHALSSFAFAVPLFVLARGYAGIIARTYPLLLAAAIAVSRMYLGVHYPSDVAVGSVLGGLIGWLLALVFVKIRKRTA